MRVHKWERAGVRGKILCGVSPFHRQITTSDEKVTCRDCLKKMELEK